MRRKLYLLLVTTPLVAPTAFGAVSDEGFEQLRRELQAVSKRLEELAAENAELRRSQDRTAAVVADVQNSVAPASWSERIRLDGDFRYRFETIDIENSPSRDRNRIRARANIRADVADDVEIGFGLATGSDDPVSTNQTLGGGTSSKNVVLDLVYADWKATDGLHLIAGKYKNPLLRVGGQPLMFDGDWRPEGIAVSYKRDWWFLNAIGAWFESDNRKANDNFSWGAQIGAAGEIGGGKLKGGIAYYSIKTKGESTTFGDPGDRDDYFGNTAVEPGGLPCGSTPDTSCVFLHDYLLTEVFAEAALNVGNWPTVIYFDFVTNSDPADKDTGWTIGTRIGQAKDRGDIEFTYYYADKEADSMFGLVTDSDFGGGGVDNKGHFLKVNFGVNKNLSIGAQYFINEIDVSSSSRRDYERLMIDAQWKWK
ncbi:MAG: putative porin [Woeseia sp.]